MPPLRRSAQNTLSSPSHPSATVGPDPTAGPSSASVAGPSSAPAVGASPDAASPAVVTSPSIWPRNADFLNGQERSGHAKSAMQYTALLPTLNPTEGLSLHALLRHLIVSQVQATRVPTGPFQLGALELHPGVHADDIEAEAQYTARVPTIAPMSRPILPMLPRCMVNAMDRAYWSCAPLAFWDVFVEWFGNRMSGQWALPAPIYEPGEPAATRMLNIVYQLGMPDVDIANLLHRGFTQEFGPQLRERLDSSNGVLFPPADLQAAVASFVTDPLGPVGGNLPPLQSLSSGPGHSLTVAALPSSAAPNLNLPGGTIELAGDAVIRDNVPYVWHKSVKSRAKTAPTDPRIGQTPAAPPPSLVPCECQVTQQLSAGTRTPVCAMNPSQLGTACDTPGTSCSECSFQASAVTSARLDLFWVLVLLTMPGDRTSADLGSLHDCLRKVALDLAHNASVPPARRALALGQAGLSAEAAGFSADDADLSYPQDLLDSRSTANPHIPWVPYRVASAPDVPCPIPQTINGAAQVVSSADTGIMAVAAGVRVWHEGIVHVVPPSSIVLCSALACARCAHYSLVCEAPDGMLSRTNQRNCRPCARVPTRICLHNELWDRMAQRGRHLAQMVLDFAAWVLGHASRPGSASGITWSTFLQAVLMGRWSDLGVVPPVPVSDSDVLESWGHLHVSWDAHPWMLEAPPHMALGIAPTRQDLGLAPRVEAAELDG